MSLRRDSAMLRGHTLVTGAHDGSKAGQNPAKPVYFFAGNFCERGVRIRSVLRSQRSDGPSAVL